MVKQRNLTPEAINRVQAALAEIGAQDDETLPAEPITSISRDPETGQISVAADTDTEPLLPGQVLEQLSDFSDILGKTPEIVTRNTRLVSRLGASALEQSSPDATESQYLLANLQSIHRKMIPAILVSTELRSTPGAFGVLMRFLQPNPRLEKHYRRRDQEEDR